MWAQVLHEELAIARKMFAFVYRTCILPAVKHPSPTELVLLNTLGATQVSAQTLKEWYREETRREIPHGTFYTTMSRLKDGGWVKTRRSHFDGRVINYAMTAKGLRNLKHVKALLKP